MSAIKFDGESANNYEQKCLCVLVLDTSGSMNEIVDYTNAVNTGETRVVDGVSYNVVTGGTSRLDKLREGLASFYKDIEDDPATAQKLEVAVITFNDDVKILQNPALIEECPPPHINAHGMTNISDAMNTAMELVEARKKWYRSTGQNYYRPWIILITDGEPNAGQDMNYLAQKIRDEVARKHFEFLPIGVDNANMNILNILSANIKALPLEGTKFSQFFRWLSASMSTIISDEDTQFEQTDGSSSDWINSFYEI